MTTETDNQFKREFDEMWNAQLLDYPTITRNEAGEWNYFDVTPEKGSMLSPHRARSWRSKPCASQGVSRG